MRGLACALVFVLGCEASHTLDDRLERMMDQPRADTWERSEAFPDRRVMRPPPEGTEPRVLDRLQAETSNGFAIALDREAFERGRNRYEIFCAPCHGVAGDADTIVAANMSLRPPPSLLEPRLKTLSPTRLEEIIAKGYGLMPGYGHALNAHDRWRVAAYVRALQVSSAIPIVSLPANIHEEAVRALP